MLEQLNHRLKEYEPPVKTFAIFGLINYPIFYFVFHYSEIRVDASMVFRLIVTIICVFLLFQSLWKKKMRKYFALIWYTSITFSLPFMGTFFFLLNHGSIIWVSNMMIMIIWLSLCTDWLSFIFVSLIGCSLGYLVYIGMGNTIYFQSPHMPITFINYFWAIVIAAVFSQNREAINTIKIQTLRSLSAMMAHEIRTPLFAIGTSLSGLQHCIQKQLSQSNKKSEEARQLTENLERSIHSSLTFIDMFVKQANMNDISHEIKMPISIASCIRKSVQLYPFKTDEKALIHLKIEHDFHIEGIEIYMVHVFFNLLKNAIYHIKSAQKGHITIWTEALNGQCIVHFKDTGPGMPPSVAKRVFDSFFSRTPHGTGIGLTYCKMVIEAFQGSIQCYSVKHEWTHFTLKFNEMKRECI